MNQRQSITTAITTLLLLMLVALVAPAGADSPLSRRYLGTFIDYCNYAETITYNNKDGKYVADLMVTLGIEELNATTYEGIYSVKGKLTVEGTIEISNPDSFQPDVHLVTIDSSDDFSDSNILLFNLQSQRFYTQNPITIPDFGGVYIYGYIQEDRFTGAMATDLEMTANSSAVSGRVETGISLYRTTDVDDDKYVQPTGPFTIESDGGTLPFDFSFNDEEWIFSNIEGFDSASGAYDNDSDSLTIGIPGNTNTFSFWESPRMAFTDATDGADLSLMKYRVGSTVTNRSQAPVSRFRTSRYDFQYTAEYWVSSSGNGGASPSASGDHEYYHYVRFPAGSQVFRNYFDLLNFDPTDASSGLVALESQEVNVSAQGTLESHATFKFAEVAATDDDEGEPASTRGFISEVIGSYGGQILNQPTLSLKSEGLSIIPKDQDNTLQVGMWTLPEATSNIPMYWGRVYRARYVFKIDAATHEQRFIPTFRARINDGAFQTASVVVRTSSNNGSLLSIGKKEINVDVYHTVLEANDGEKMLLSFDMIYEPDLHRPIEILLDRIEVGSFPILDEEWPR